NKCINRRTTVNTQLSLPGITKPELQASRRFEPQGHSPVLCQRCHIRLDERLRRIEEIEHVQGSCQGTLIEYKTPHQPDVNGFVIGCHRSNRGASSPRSALGCQYADNTLIQPPDRQNAAVRQTILITSDHGCAEAPARFRGGPKASESTAIEERASPGEDRLVWI